MVEISTDHLGHDAATDTAAPAAAGEHRSDARLAAAIGINRRTIYKLRDRGAPTSRDEAAWRSWCSAQMIRLRAPLVVDLADDIPRGTVPPAPAAPAPAAASNGLQDKPEGGWSPAQAKALADAQLRDLQAMKVRKEIAVLDRELISRDDARRIALGLAAVFVHELVDIPAQVVRILDQLPVEWRRPMRRAIEQAIEGLRDRLSVALREKLAAVLAGPKGGGHAG